MDKRRILALTPGDPAGIGPDLAVLLADQPIDHRIVIIADRNMLLERADAMNCKPSFRDYHADSNEVDGLQILHVDCDLKTTPGLPGPGCAPYILRTLDMAVKGCLTGEFDAMVTGPINKETITRSGTQFSGHTEYLAKQTGSNCPVMLLSDGELRVALVTTHLPLSEVPQSISKSRIVDVARVLNNDLRTRFNIPSPRIGVCGLNPHAGEGGTLGREEITEIIPAIEQLQDEGINITGPLPADTIFTKNRLTEFDAVLSMYHDQGLPVIKHGAFGEVVNITLGLPIIRTSVDHGTAYDIAGTGKANVGSLLHAISTAGMLCVSKDE